MFKRIIWMGTGMAIGAGGAFWAKRKAEEAIEQYLPEQVAIRAAESARGIGSTVRVAAAEGREAMRATEAELRARVDARTFVGEAPPKEVPRSAGKGTRRAGRVATHGAPGASDRRTRR